MQTAQIEYVPAHPVGGEQTYTARLRTRDGDRVANGGLVVISGNDRQGNPLADNGCIGVLDIQAGYETLNIKLNCVHVRMNTDQVRALKIGERVANPEGGR